MQEFGGHGARRFLFPPQYEASKVSICIILPLPDARNPFAANARSILGITQQFALQSRIFQIGANDEHERDESLDQITVRDHQDCHSLSVALFARPADQHEQKAESKIPSSESEVAPVAMSDPSERQSNDTANQAPTHVSSSVGNGIADCCAQVPLSGDEPPSLGGEAPAPVFWALPHFRSYRPGPMKS